MQGSLQSFSDKMSTIITDLGSLKKIFYLFILLHFVIGAIIPPLVTSDFERNLFYGKNFWRYGFDAYDMTPLEIDSSYDVKDPLSNQLSYPNTTYDYPTLQLLFWAGLSPIPFSNIIGKWFLSLFDVINYFLIYFLMKSRENEEEKLVVLDKGFALSYLLLSIPFSAIEGQSTSITIFFLLLPLFLHRQYPVGAYLSVGLGFHWKYVSLLILPYFLVKDREVIRQAWSGLVVVITSIIILSFPLLFSSFILRYFSSFGDFGEYSGQLPSNPLLLLYPSISSLLSTGLLIFALIYLVGFFPRDIPIKKDLEGIAERAYWLPFILLLSFLKIHATAFPWYWMWFYPCLVILPQKNMRLFVILLGVTFTFGLIDFIQMTVGVITFIELFF